MQDTMTVNDYLLMILMNDRESYDAICENATNDAKKFRDLITELVSPIRRHVPESAEGKYCRYLLILDLYAEMVDHGNIGVEEVELLLKEAGYTASVQRWQDNTMTARHSRGVKPSEEGTKMQFLYEDKVFIDGDDASTLKDDYLFTVMIEAQNRIRELEKIEEKHQPQKLKDEVQRIKDFIFKVRDYVDKRSNHRS